jgi:hypothetical protein
VFSPEDKLNFGQANQVFLPFGQICFKHLNQKNMKNILFPFSSIVIIAFIFLLPSCDSTSGVSDSRTRIDQEIAKTLIDRYKTGINRSDDQTRYVSYSVEELEEMIGLIKKTKRATHVKIYFGQDEFSKGDPGVVKPYNRLVLVFQPAKMDGSNLDDIDFVADDLSTHPHNHGNPCPPPTCNGRSLYY